MNRSHLFTASLLALLAGCVGRPEREHPLDRPLAARRVEDVDPTRPPLDAAGVDRFGFTLYWDAQIPGQVITSVTMEGDQLYAFTHSQRLYQIDVHSGRVNWVYEVGRPLEFAFDRRNRPGRPIAEWVYQADPDGMKRYDELFFVAGEHLYALDKAHGSELWVVRLPFTPSSAPEASGTHVLLGSHDDRVYALRKDNPRVVDWSWRTDADVLTRPAVESPSAFVASSDGRLYTFEVGSGKPEQPMKTERRLLVDPIVDKKLLYLAAQDYNLYVINVIDGLLEYRFGAGAELISTPVPIERRLQSSDGNTVDRTTIYFAAEGQGMFALLRGDREHNRTSHELRWQREGADQVLCQGMESVYLLEPTARTGRYYVSKIDEATGKALERVLGGMGDPDHPEVPVVLPPVDYFVTNRASPTAPTREASLRGGILFMGFQNGWIFALKEKATIPGGAK